MLVGFVYKENERKLVVWSNVIFKSKKFTVLLDTTLSFKFPNELIKISMLKCSFKIVQISSMNLQ